MKDRALLCVAARPEEVERIRLSLAREGIEVEVADGDTLVVLEFGGFLRGVHDVWVAREDHVRARAILEEGVPCFGAELLRELEAQGSREVVTRRFRYAGIQRLKSASRPDVLELFRGSDYELLQRVKQDSPAELARFLVRRFDQARVQGALAIFFLGAMLS